MMINIPTNVKQGVDLNSQSIPVSVRGGISTDFQSAADSKSRVASSQSVMPEPKPGEMSRQPIKRPSGPIDSGRQGTGTILKKGQKSSLTGLSPGLKMVDVCLGWDTGGQPQYDLDTECFMLGSDEKVIGDEWVVFYNQPISPDGAVRHCSDNKTGSGKGDDEILHINLAGMSPQVQRLLFIITINEARERRLNFSGVRDAFIRIVDKADDRELIRYSVSEYYSTVTSMVVGEIYRYKGEWKFTPIGDGTGDDLAGLCVRYGVVIAE